MEYRVTNDMLIDRPLSASSLKSFSKSPRHYVEYLHKQRVESDSMTIGQIVETIALEGEDSFKNKFQVYQKPNLRTKDGKADMEVMTSKAKEEKKMLVTKEQEEVARIMVERLMEHPVASKLIEKRTHVQRKLKWNNGRGEDKLPMIGYLDFESEFNGLPMLVDLKTTRDADPNNFYKDAAKYQYHLQAAAYLDAYHKKWYEFPGFIFLCVENVSPWNVSVNYCDAKYLNKAKEEYQFLLQAFRKCLNEQRFHEGYEFWLMDTKEYHSLYLPNWYSGRNFTGE